MNAGLPGPIDRAGIEQANGGEFAFHFARRRLRKRATCQPRQHSQHGTAKGDKHADGFDHSPL
jgi:hypothetical protein